MIAKVHKYIVNLEYDDKNGEVAELVDVFTRPDGREMYTLMFNDGQLKGYYHDEIESLFKIVE